MSTITNLTICLIVIVSIVSLDAFSIEKKSLNKSTLKKIHAESKLVKKDSMDTSDESDVDSSSEVEETTDLRFLYQCIDQHNQYRRTNKPDATIDSIVLYSSEIERISRRRALKYASSGKLSFDSINNKLSTSDGIAEQVAFTSIPNNNSSAIASVDCRPIVDFWYSNAYGIEKESIPIETESAEKIKKFTVSKKLSTVQLRQFIWHKANEIGCAQYSSFSSSNPGVYTVCNYRFTESSL